MTGADWWNRTRYRLYAPVYDWVARPLERGRERAIERLGIRPSDRILILGSGTGMDLDYLPAGVEVVAGMFLAGAGVLGMVLVSGYRPWLVLAGVSGLGMALLYPNLMTVPSDACHPSWRSAGMGVYRMWRDAGYGVGAVLIGLSMQFVGIEAAFYMTGLSMLVSGAVVYLLMEETHPDFGTHTPPAPAPDVTDRIVSEEQA